jgi:predicted ribosome quality control (RQC) complex YloA/Tae2 family protein
LGAGAGQLLISGNNNIDINNSGVADESDTTRIGFFQTRTFIAGIRGATTGSGDTLPVLIDVNGQLGTASSSRRFKNEIKPMDQTSESILGLKPVTFHYKSDKTGTPQFGLIAEEVAEVNPDLVVRDENREIYTVRYDAVNAMLLNEFLKEHRTVQELKSTAAKQEATIAQQRKDFQATITQQQKEIQALSVSLKEQASQIEKVSAQIELNRPVPQQVVLKTP